MSVQARQGGWLRGLGARVVGNFPLLLLGFALSRLLIVPVRVALLVGSDKYFDYRHFFEMGRLTDQGFYPLLHFWVEYPPVFPWLVALSYRLGQTMGDGLAVEAWFYTLTAILRVTAEVGSLWLLYHIARHLWGEAIAWRSALLYALLFVPYYLWTGAFDTLPTLCFLGAIWLLLRGRVAASGAVAGLGFATKVFPALAVLVGVVVLPTWRAKLACVLAAGAVVAALYGPFAVANPAMTLASLQNLSGRVSWQSVWALLEGNYKAGGVAPMGKRLEPGSAVAGNTPPPLLWYPAVAAAGVAGALIFRRLWNRQVPLAIVAAAALSLHLLMVTARGYSPQFLTWVAPWVAILLPNRWGVVGLALLGVANLIEYPGYFHFLPGQPAVLALAIILRTTVLIALAIVYARMAVRAAGSGAGERATL